MRKASAKAAAKEAARSSRSPETMAAAVEAVVRKAKREDTRPLLAELALWQVETSWGLVLCAVCLRAPERGKTLGSKVYDVVYAAQLGHPSLTSPAVVVCHRCLTVAVHVARWGGRKVVKLTPDAAGKRGL